MKTQGTGQRKKKTGFVPYDYESAFEHSCEMLAADEVARLLRDRKKCVHATKEIRAGNQLEVEIYPEFTKLPATIPRKKNTAAQKDLNDRNSQKECVRTINENFGPRDLCTFTTLCTAATISTRNRGSFTRAKPARRSALGNQNRTTASSAYNCATSKKHAAARHQSPTRRLECGGTRC